MLEFGIGIYYIYIKLEVKAMGKKKEPICPLCKIEGIKHIVSQESEQKSRIDEAWFDVVYCSNCGHVYGVFAKAVNRPLTQYDYQKK